MPQAKTVVLAGIMWCLHRRMVCLFETEHSESLTVRGRNFTSVDTRILTEAWEITEDIKMYANRWKNAMGIKSYGRGNLIRREPEPWPEINVQVSHYSVSPGSPRQASALTLRLAIQQVPASRLMLGRLTARCDKTRFIHWMTHRMERTVSEVCCCWYLKHIGSYFKALPYIPKYHKRKNCTTEYTSLDFIVKKPSERLGTLNFENFHFIF